MKKSKEAPMSHKKIAGWALAAASAIFLVSAGPVGAATISFRLYGGYNFLRGGEFNDGLNGFHESSSVRKYGVEDRTMSCESLFL